MDLIPRNHFFDDAFDLIETKGWKDTNMMKSDIYEKDGKYHLEADLPGFDKNNIHVDYKDGYLTIQASKEDNFEENNKYIRRERHYGEVSRSFYVGDIDEKEIKAKFKDGSLKITFPKENEERKQTTSIFID